MGSVLVSWKPSDVHSDADGAWWGSPGSSGCWAMMGGGWVESCEGKQLTAGSRHGLGQWVARAILVLGATGCAIGSGVGDRGWQQPDLCNN